MKTLNKTLIATAVALSCTQVMAAGFQLNSQSATGIGRAFSGDAAIGDNASILARNPAGMALFEKAAFSGGLTYGDIQVEINDVTTDLGPAGTRNIGSIDDAAENKWIPNAFYIHPINDKIAVGVAAFSNFGTGTDAGALADTISLIDPTNPATAIPAPVDLLGNTEVITINLNASVSYRFNDHVSIGAGFDAIYGEGKVERTSAATGDLVDVDADGWGFGGIVGGLFELNDNHRWGISYRFSPDVDVEGDLDTTLPGLGTVGWDELEVPLGDIFQIGGFHQLTDKFALHYTAQYTSWSDFDQITLSDPDVAAAVPLPNELALKTYEWDDSWLFSVGGTYSLNDKWTLRAGYLHDKGVVDKISSLSIPDSDRNWFTGGFTYHLSPKSDIDFGFAAVRGEDVDVIENSPLYQGLIDAGTLPPFISSDIMASTRSDAYYYSMQYSYKF